MGGDLKECLVCGSPGLEFFVGGLWDGPERQRPDPPLGKEAWRCQECGSYTYFPLETAEEMAAYHDAEYFICHNPARQKGYANYLDPEHLQIKRDWGRRMAGWLYQFDLHKDEKEKWALDFGCAVGATTAGLQEFHLAQIRAVGVDVCPNAVRWGQRQGLDLHCGRLMDLELSRGRFDYAIFWDALNHDPEPRSILQEMAWLLRPGGLAIIHTPDATLAAPDWMYWSPHQHSCAFTEEGLRRALAAASLTLFKRRPSPMPQEMVLLARKDPD